MAILFIYGVDIDARLLDLVLVVTGLKERPYEVDARQLIELGPVEMKAEALSVENYVLVVHLNIKEYTH